MRDVYTAKLSRLSDEILEMGNLCSQAIMKTCQILASVDVRETATKDIAKIEKEIDDKEHNIEALCMQLLLKQQPVGSDLRKISAALKMVTDMERIGDQATDIAEIMNTGSVHVPVTAIPLQEMADHAMHMVNDSVTAYVEGKSDLAKIVCLYEWAVVFCGLSYFTFLYARQAEMAVIGKNVMYIWLDWKMEFFQAI